MITEKQKSLAIAKMKNQTPLDLISEEMEIPMGLLKEWHKKLNPNDLIAIESNIIAVERVVNGEIEGVDNNKLKDVLEEAAQDIAKQVGCAVISGDPLHAKALELCSKAVCGLYQIIVLKNNSGSVELPGTRPSGSGLSSFQQLMKD